MINYYYFSCSAFLVLSYPVVCVFCCASNKPTDFLCPVFFWLLLFTFRLSFIFLISNSWSQYIKSSFIVLLWMVFTTFALFGFFRQSNTKASSTPSFFLHFFFIFYLLILDRFWSILSCWRGDFSTFAFLIVLSINHHRIDEFWRLLVWELRIFWMLREWLRMLADVSTRGKSLWTIRWIEINMPETNRASSPLVYLRGRDGKNCSKYRYAPK